MPIKFSFKKLPVDADGKSYDSLEAFQAAEIAKLSPTITAEAAEDIVNVKEEIIEILELTMESRPSARGVKKQRKSKTNGASEPDRELPIATDP